ncbi:DUF1033 family protein [Lactococcus piscium]|nr:DUF1033 family protein [Lactococcus piscium]
MYRVVEMRGDNEPWWFFENWLKTQISVNPI